MKVLHASVVHLDQSIRYSHIRLVTIAVSVGSCFSRAEMMPPAMLSVGPYVYECVGVNQFRTKSSQPFQIDQLIKLN